MKLVVLLLTVLASAHCAPTESKWDATVEVLEGTIQGFFSEYPAFKACLNDTVSVYDDIDAAIGLLEQKTPASVLAGIKDLGMALTGVKAALVDCKAAETDIENIGKALEQFKTPASFAYHVGKDLLVNHKDILAEINQAVSLWKSASYLPAGIQIGEALNKLLLGDKWSYYAVHSSLEGPTPKSKCALECTAGALGVYWACAGACIAKQAPNSCILEGCPAAVTAFDIPCLKSCKGNGTSVH